MHGWGTTVALVATARSTPRNARSGGGINNGKGVEVHEDATPVVTPHLKPWKFLENAVACLVEAREILSVLATSAEPVGDTLISFPVDAHAMGPSPQNAEKSTEHGAGDGEGGNKAKSPGSKGKGQAKQSKGKKSPGVTQGGGPASSGELDAPRDSEHSLRGVPCEPAAVSTPVGRVLVMVQLEEACVRAMLGRAKGENRSKSKAEEAAANDKGVTPVQR